MPPTNAKPSDGWPYTRQGQCLPAPGLQPKRAKRAEWFLIQAGIDHGQSARHSTKPVRNGSCANADLREFIEFITFL